MVAGAAPLNAMLFILLLVVEAAHIIPGGGAAHLNLVEGAAHINPGGGG